ncbi:SMI1/KNR4 family protein [Pedobacter terrae]|uniref:SMI1/KNR4 family protein n=1 Tax=Pedobacter terrae TaxID=405671 RepID=UPI002FF7E126
MSKFKAFFAKHKDRMNALGVKLNPPSTNEDICKLEIAVGHVLPEDIKSFYSYCNGFDTEDWIFNVLSIEQILYYKSELKLSEFYFAEYMIYTDNWRIKIENSDTYFITNGNHKENQQLVLTNSIFEFLKVYFNSDGVLSENGLYKWFEKKNSNR